MLTNATKEKAEMTANSAAKRCWRFGTRNYQLKNKATMEHKKLNTEDTANSNSGAVSGCLLYDKLAVIIQTKDGKIFQVALDKEMNDALFSELKMLFNGGIVKILPTEINGITLE